MKHRYMSVLIVVGALFGGMVAIDGASALQKASNPREPDTIALGQEEVKQLLLLMDTDKNGKVSKQEFMKFMEEEFDRLDKDKSGELDPKELSQSRLRPATFAKVGK